MSSVSTDGAARVKRWLASTAADLGSDLVANVVSATNVRDYGAKPDTGADLTSQINAALAAGGDVWFPPGTYRVDGLTSILLQNNQKVFLHKRAQVHVIPNNSAGVYAAIKALDVSNVELHGGYIVGDKDTHLGVTGESGMGVLIQNSANVGIYRTRAYKCWGDGVYVGGTGTEGKSANVVLEDVLCDGNRRNGITIAAVKGCRVNRPVCCNTAGTAPEAGLDIEPNPTKGRVDDVEVTGGRFYGNAGVGLAASQTICTNVRIIGCDSYLNGTSGMQFGYVGSGLKVLGNKVWENGLHGIWVFGASAYYTNDIEVCHNTVEKNLGDGIRMTRNVRDYKVLRNTVRENGMHGINLDRDLAGGGSAVDDGEVASNTCRANSQQAHNTYNNIHLGEGLHNFNVHHNICRKGGLTNKPKWGIGLANAEYGFITDNDVMDGGETATIGGSINAAHKIVGNPGFKTECQVESAAFAVDAVTVVTVNINHGLAYTPALHHCNATIIDTSAVGFYEGKVAIQAADATKVVMRVAISTAAAGGSTAKLALRVTRPYPI